MKIIKNNKGFTQIDIAISIVILILFVSIIASLYINSYNSSKSSGRDSEATVYLTRALETIDLINYDDLEDSTNGIVAKINQIDSSKLSAGEGNETFQPSEFETTPYKMQMHVNIQKYNETNGNTDKEDLIKIITLNIFYKNKKGNPITAKRLKTREIEYVDSLGIKPNLLDGMIPLNNSNENKATTQYSSTWFDYSNSKVAEIMLKDNGEPENNGEITNAGSKLIYIPRFIYKKTTDNEDNQHIEIKFVDVNNKCLDGSYVDVFNEEATIEEDKYYIPQIFTQNNIELPGLWVGKYICRNQLDVSSGQSNIDITGDANLQILNYNEYKIENMTIAGNRYGLSEDTNIQKAGDDTDNNIQNILDLLDESEDYSFITDDYIKDTEIDNSNAFRIFIF